MIARAAVLFAAGGLLYAACAPPASEPVAPNIVLVLVDTLRADRLGAYGNPDGHSPVLDEIAREGVVFERAIAPAPWTQPAIASLFSATHPGAHRVLSYQAAFDGAMRDRARVAVFDERFTTLAEALHDGGYATAAFVANPFVTDAFGFGQGFETFEGPARGRRFTGVELNEKAARWLRNRDPSRPFFLYLHYMDVHGPYEAPPDVLDPLLDSVERADAKRALTEREAAGLNYLARLPHDHRDRARHERLMGFREYWLARYDAGVRVMDALMGALREALRAQGSWDDAYLIVTADHGEALLDGGLWDHGFSVQDAELHIPLILRWPSRLPAGTRVPETVRLIDLMPTLLDQLGMPQVAGVQGRSLAPVIGGSGTSTAALAEAVKAGPEQKALYAGELKFVRVAATQDQPMTQQLFDLSTDPQRPTDISSERPDQLERLSAALDRQLAENAQRAAAGSAPSTALDATTQRQLEALGYLRDAPDPAPDTRER